MNLTLVRDISAAILRGNVLHTKLATVGPVHNATGPVEWRCLDWTRGGTPASAWHVVPHVHPDFGRDDTTEDDASPFGAAVAFVRLVGETEAKLALTGEAL